MQLKSSPIFNFINFKNSDFNVTNRRFYYNVVLSKRDNLLEHDKNHLLGSGSRGLNSPFSQLLSMKITPIKRTRNGMCLRSVLRLRHIEDNTAFKALKEKKIKQYSRYR